MNKNLGSIFLTILIFLNAQLFAKEYRWSADLNKQEAFVNEAIHLKYVCEFNDRAELYSIEFNPVGSYEDYELILLREDIKIQNNKKINTYEFVAFVKKSGKIDFDFSALMKKTNKDSIENTVLGRDNAEYEEFSKTIEKQKLLSVDVKESKSDLVGEFSLEVKKDKAEKKAYDPYHLEFIIKGVGSFQFLKPIEFKIDGVKVFSQKAIDKTTLTKDGYEGVWSQKFAFVSEKDFEIPKLSISYMDVNDDSIKAMSFDAKSIKVKKGYEKAKLLDKDESVGFELSYEFIYYLLTFIAGYLFAKIRFKTSNDKEIKDPTFAQKINGAKSFDELLVILVLKDPKKYKRVIEDIENNKTKSLKNVKKELFSV